VTGLCGETGCPRPARKRGRCNTHYEQLRRAGLLEVREKDPVLRFWSHIDREGPEPVNGTPGRCWLWTASTANGYGQVDIFGQLRRAHRVAYELLVGPVSDGLDLDHLCRVRACCNPAHLEPVPRRTNVLRGEGLAAMHAARDECDHGHRYTPDNVYRWRGGRYCRTCRREADRRRRVRRRAARSPHA
jgi:hypothetical protein